MPLNRRQVNAFSFWLPDVDHTLCWAPQHHVCHIHIIISFLPSFHETNYPYFIEVVKAPKGHTGNVWGDGYQRQFWMQSSSFFRGNAALLEAGINVLWTIALWKILKYVNKPKFWNFSNTTSTLHTSIFIYLSLFIYLFIFYLTLIYVFKHILMLFRYSCHISLHLCKRSICFSYLPTPKHSHAIT